MPGAQSEAAEAACSFKTACKYCTWRRRSASKALKRCLDSSVLKTCAKLDGLQELRLQQAEQVMIRLLWQICVFRLLRHLLEGFRPQMRQRFQSAPRRRISFMEMDSTQLFFTGAFSSSVPRQRLFSCFSSALRSSR